MKHAAQKHKAGLKQAPLSSSGLCYVDWMPYPRLGTSIVGEGKWLCAVIGKTPSRKEPWIEILDRDEEGNWYYASNGAELADGLRVVAIAASPDLPKWIDATITMED